MKKNIVFITMLVAMVAPSVFAGSNETVEVADRGYFDSQFNKLQQAVAEVKGDTTQIAEILGNVFEGTVPSGGTLIGLCDKNGWSLVVLMGHNGISKPDTVVADAKFSYPKTPEEFQMALKKGKPLYHEWLKTRSTTFRVNRIKADTVEIDQLVVRVAKFTEKLEVKDMEIDALTVRVARITEKLTVKEMEIGKLRVENAEIDHLKIRLAELDDLRIQLLTVNEALIEKLRINQLQLNEEKRAKVLAQERAQAAESRPPVIEKQVVYEEIGYNAPTSMRLLKDGDVCDEGIVHGGVPAAVWKATGGQSVAIFELHQRSDDSKIADGTEYKAKSLVVVNASTAIPMVWDDGTCVRKYSSEPIDESGFRSMMSTEEKLDMIEFSDVNKKFKGRHNTIGVLLRYAK